MRLILVQRRDQEDSLEVAEGKWASASAWMETEMRRDIWEYEGWERVETPFFFKLTCTKCKASDHVWNRVLVLVINPSVAASGKKASPSTILLESAAVFFQVSVHLNIFSSLLSSLSNPTKHVFLLRGNAALRKAFFYSSPSFVYFKMWLHSWNPKQSFPRD